MEYYPYVIKTIWSYHHVLIRIVLYILAIRDAWIKKKKKRKNLVKNIFINKQS